MSIAAARAGLVDLLQGIGGLHVYPVWPSLVQTPGAVVVLSDWSYGPTFDGQMDATFLIAVMTQMGSVEKAQTDLDAYLELDGAASIAAAIRADPTLGGVVQVADVVGGTRYQTDEIDGITRLVPAIQVEVKW